MKLSIVILNYNVRYFLELCLKSVQAAIKDIEAEIIVVDNDSKDTSCQMLKELFPKVKLIENTENYGFSKGNNIGVAQAKGEYICILNPDTVVAEDTFVKLLSFADSKTDLGIVGCKLINGAGEFLPESKRNVPYVKVAFKKMLGKPELYYANHIEENGIGKTKVLVGAFMLMKRDVFLEVGGFDEDYFMYGEDIDLSYRIYKAGYSNYYYGETTILHYKGESTLRDKHYVRRFYGAMQIFYQKHFKKNLICDLTVWSAVRMAYFLNTAPVKNDKQVGAYAFMSTTMNESLKAVLPKEVVLKNCLEAIQDTTEIIFDGNSWKYKDIISAIEQKKTCKAVTYKILPKDSSYIIGSDNAICRGEIINLT
ncbi:glycosyltransferase family 2 protein [Aestuariibaculum suncheonense]|uniref:Glycosyltransferase family 2 protein n=1 Tax=Aestuariibaculum suncheonense TaxID=1028745 RepID=A0A8J6UJ70_9FLAO|nr:glycosyltransferase family 2 protein [Aestuariibaculum suncheonense]MBD0834571.1 glycosyltransferase family 2 protein [Aestuariibaculum suncheonense]